MACISIVFIISLQEYLLDCHGCRNTLWLARGAATDGNVGRVLHGTGRIRHIIEQRNTRKLVVLVDAVTRSELVTAVRPEIDHARSVGLAKDLGHDEERVEDGSNGPLMEGRLVSRGRWSQV